MSEETKTEVENYPMDDALIAVMSEVKTAMEQLVRAAQDLELQRKGALILFIRQHNLQGNWNVAENGRELVKQPDTPPPQPPQGDTNVGSNRTA